MNEPTQMFKRVQERHFSAHHMLMRVAHHKLTDAEETNLGSFNNSLVAITFSALAIEALGNVIGERIIDDWKDYESASPLAKIRLLAGHLGVPYEPQKEPWSTLRWLARFRNQIAHPKPQLVVDERLINQHEAQKRPNDPPASKLEREITVGNARRAVEAVSTLNRLLFEKMPPDQRFGIFADGWSTTTSVDHGA
jgi:hypothetical protein